MFAPKKYKLIHFIITIYKYNLSANIKLKEVIFFFFFNFTPISYI